MINSVFGGGRAPMSPLEFISRRAQRIYPLYWLLAFPVVVLIAMHLDTQQHHTVETTIRSVLLLPSETNVIWYSWTLKYEMFFYAAFALCLFSRNQLVTALGTTGLIAAMVLLGPHFGDHALREFLAKPIIFEFTLGLGLGVLYNYRPQVFSQNRLLWALGAIAGAIFIMISPRIGVPMDQLMGPMPPVRFATWGVAAAFIVAWGVGLKPFAGRTGAFFLLVGDASYALYLVHFFVMKGFALALHKVGLVQHTPSLIVGPLVIANLCRPRDRPAPVLRKAGRPYVCADAQGPARSHRCSAAERVSRSLRRQSGRTCRFRV